MAHSKNLIIIPTYNEVENILIIIDKILNLPVRFDVLVVDDNSPVEFDQPLFEVDPS